MKPIAIAVLACTAFCPSIALADPSARPDNPTIEPAPATADPDMAQLEKGSVFRVKSVSDATVEAIERSWGTEYRSGSSRVTTPIPEGYPAPTAPGAMEIKYYPSVRRAEINANGNEDGMMGWNTSRAFWPLFQHIQDRDIAMTAPVEIDYAGVSDEGRLNEDEWSMSFLYREPSLGEEGSDGAIFVYDTDPVVVLSVGVRGDLSRQEMRRAVSELSLWVSNSDEWEAAGGARKLSYNGPDARQRDRWHEVQMPIQKRGLVKTVEAPSPQIEVVEQPSEIEPATVEVDWEQIDLDG